MERKFVKVKCKKTGIYYGLDVERFGSAWKVVNMTSLPDDKARIVTSEVRQPSFETNSNLLACRICGNRKVGGCSCARKMVQCKRGMDYQFACIYCSELEVDYSLPTRADLAGIRGDKVTLEQGKEVKIVTFSNVEWTHFDNIQTHPTALEYLLIEPKKHVIANEENIEFHGYNVSEMNEGVFYMIKGHDDFEIECDVDTSTISPHPGGHLYVSFGAITAQITEKGGTFLLNGSQVAQVGSKFHMVLSVIDGCYSVVINGVKKGEVRAPSQSDVKVTFGFWHSSHHCTQLSHAYMRGIKMTHGIQRGKQ